LLHLVGIISLLSMMHGTTNIKFKIYDGVICSGHAVNSHWHSLLDIRGRQRGGTLNLLVDRRGKFSISIIHWCLYSHSCKI